ncbi:branched-chain amino acid ABC transporter permease [Nocardioides jishulii]|uniref:Branched-chain amino acid ABC transporter permease n=1 Tax=Nocardioides jishulii TaxID=2575440 RepID=A0A4U2YP76_9ACTN|nr:branched-chain amino acid ABC transporter permease [Nocardioides jishulii]QCX27658.1 branched-chain amino acid ABC transporter permease [Nocardioides jishulii]TKI62465.1 branched-chain amino acid ABC transporter permease [Nocardioides jishulii]
MPQFLTAHPLVRHLLVAALGMVVVVTVLGAVGEFRRFQLAEMASLGIAAGGLTVLTGINGQLSLGHGALMAIGAYTTALLLPDRDAGTPLLLVLLAAVAVTALVGVVLGAAAARLHGPYLAGATLALAIAVPGIALHFKGTLGGEQGLRVVMPRPPTWAEDATWFLTAQELTSTGWIAFIAWTTLIVTYVLLASLTSGRVGRRWRAVRDDEIAAQLVGIDVGRARISAFTVSAAAAGAAGCLLALVVRLSAPGSFGLVLSLTLLAVVVLGGLGSLAGALLGAGLLTFLPQVATQVGRDAGLSDIQAAELAPLVQGVVMVLVILLAPGGLAGAWRGARARLRKRGRTPGLALAGAAPTEALGPVDIDATDPFPAEPARPVPSESTKGARP